MRVGIRHQVGSFDEDGAVRKDDSPAGGRAAVVVGLGHDSSKRRASRGVAGRFNWCSLFALDSFPQVDLGVVDLAFFLEKRVQWL